MFLFQLSLHRYSSFPGFWGAEGGDTYSYLGSIDNLISHGAYSPDIRMPGYGIIYLIFRLFLSKSIACNIIIILQLILSAVSVYLLALSSMYLFNTDKFFYSVFYLFAISQFSTAYDTFVYTESFTTSFMIISVFYFLTYFKSYNPSRLLISGLLLTWGVFLKPVFGPLIIFFLVTLAADGVRKNIKLWVPILYFLAPFILSDGAWTIRNFIQHKKLLPLATSVFYQDKEDTFELPILRFTQAWGGDYFWYYSNCILKDKPAHPPAYIYTSKFNEDSLLKIRSLILSIEPNIEYKSDTTTQNLNHIVKRLDVYTASIKSEKPFLYYIRAPLSLFTRFIIFPGISHSLFNKNNDKLTKIEFIINGLYYLLYLAIVFLGSIGIVAMFRVLFSLQPQSIFPFIPLYTIIVHVFIFRFCENRYFVPAYPFMLVCGVYVIFKLNEARKSNSILL
jgi:hypothetical protein